MNITISKNPSANLEALHNRVLFLHNFVFTFFLFYFCYYDFYANFGTLFIFFVHRKTSTESVR